jgi:hypothetical protein
VQTVNAEAVDCTCSIETLMRQGCRCRGQDVAGDQAEPQESNPFGLLSMSEMQERMRGELTVADAVPVVGEEVRLVNSQPNAKSIFVDSGVPHERLEMNSGDRWVPSFQVVSADRIAELERKVDVLYSQLLNLSAIMTHHLY